jgi:hypothetical protein
VAEGAKVYTHRNPVTMDTGVPVLPLGQPLTTTSPTLSCITPSLQHVIQVQPVYYSTFIQSAGQIINLFGSNDTVIISSGPTEYITNYFVTTTIVNSIPATQSDSTMSSGASNGGSLSASTTALSPSASTPYIPASTIGTAGQPSNSSIHTPIPPPATLTPEVVPVQSTFTATDGKLSSSTVFQSPLPVGTAGGLPAGKLDTLPASLANQGVIIVVGIPSPQNSDAPGKRGVRWIEPEKPSLNTSSESKTGSPILVERADTTNQDSIAVLNWTAGGTSRGCDAARPWFLNNGQLTDSSGQEVSRDLDQESILFAPSFVNRSVDTQFTFENGILAWTTSDLGNAFFFQCSDDGLVYAGFPNPPKDGCWNVTLAGVKQSSCPVALAKEAADASSSSSSSSQATSLSTTDLFRSSTANGGHVSSLGTSSLLVASATSTQSERAGALSTRSG